MNCIVRVKSLNRLGLASVVWLAACASVNEASMDTGSENEVEPEPFYLDEDEDGYKSNVDCDDNDYRFHPGAAELCDGEDNDCDGDIDEGFDADGDGYDSAIECGGEDCDDEEDSIHPGATEQAYDGIDQNCDGTDLVDVDGDGYRAQEVGGTDCDDTSPSVYPGAMDWLDFIDTACDGADEIDLAAIDQIINVKKNHLWSAIVSNGGDVNGDGFDDFLIGGIGEGLSVFHGSTEGAAVSNPDDADHIVRGWTTADVFWNFASAGDVNGDGYDDVMSSYINKPHTAGEIFLFYGSKNGITTANLSRADATLTGMDDFQPSMSSAGDVNGDGFDDVVIGLPFVDSHSRLSGSAFLVLGTVRGIPSLDLTEAGAEYAGANSMDFAGAAVAGAGDINGDGYSDVMIGAEGFRLSGRELGAVYIVEGDEIDPGDMSLTGADATVMGEDNGDRVGDVLSSAGDVNGDGYHDLLIGAPRHKEGTGRAYIVYGSSTGVADMNLESADAKITGDFEGQATGSSVSTAGDVNADGFDDVMVGALGLYGGAAYIVTGSNKGMSDIQVGMANAKLVGDAETSVGAMGASIANAGDVNADGFDDVLFGSYGNGNASAYLLHGF